MSSSVKTEKATKAVNAEVLTNRLKAMLDEVSQLRVTVGTKVPSNQGDREIAGDLCSAVSALCGVIDTADVKRANAELDQYRIPNFQFPVTDWLKTENIPSVVLEEMAKAREASQKNWAGVEDNWFPTTNPAYIIATGEGNGFLSPEGVFYTNGKDGHSSTGRNICSALGIPVTSNRNGESMLCDTCGWVKFALYNVSAGSYKTTVMRSILWRKKMTKKQEEFVLGLDREAKARGWAGLSDNTLKCLLERASCNNSW